MILLLVPPTSLITRAVTLTGSGELSTNPDQSIRLVLTEVRIDIAP